MEIEIIDETSDSQSNVESSSASTVNNPVASNEEKPTAPPTAGKSSAYNTRLTRQTCEIDSLLKDAARLGLTSSTDKFLRNFNPENSNRERRKLTRKLVQNNKRAYDGKGILLACNRDLCDCLNDRCPGCFFPCPKCRSCKCGHECRNFRKWVYESAEVQGSRKITHNPFKHLLKKNS